MNLHQNQNNDEDSPGMRSAAGDRVGFALLAVLLALAIKFCVEHQPVDTDDPPRDVQLRMKLSELDADEPEQVTPHNRPTKF